MVHRIKTHYIVLGLASLSALPLLASDGEWPPKADPQWSAVPNLVINNPDPPGTPGAFNPHLYLDRLQITIPNSPVPYATWLTHWHNSGGCGGFGDWYTDFTIGDVDNDGLQDDIVITQPGEAVFAAELQIDWLNLTATLNPHWLWLSPYATTVLGGNPNNHATAGYSCNAANRNNALIWNVVDDGPTDSTNEVAFVGLDEFDRERLYILRHSGAGSVSVVATSPTNKLFEVDHRLSIAKVRNTAFPRDIVMSEHGQGRAFLWSWENGALTHKYTGDPFTHPGILAKVHECNWADVDGDGFDEFALNGLVDFVDADANGNPVPTNGQQGVARWQIMASESSGDGNGGHCDMVLIGDWDPTRYGLEMYAVTETGGGGKWKEAQTGILHSRAYDTLWDADCGTLLDAWDQAPADDGQDINAGNWSSSLAGIEAIMSPKDLPASGLVLPPGQNLMDGSYVVSTRVTPSTTDSDFQLLAIDGSVYDGPVRYEHEGSGGNPDAVNNVKIRSGGPWRRMWGMDWDGDYKSDEILHHPFNFGNLILFALHDKQDLVPGSYPPGVPTQAQVQSSTPPIPEGTSCGSPGTWYFYYQGDCGEHIPPATGANDWSFNNGGPGRGTHYFEKLKEVWPGTGDRGALVVHPYDLEGSADHREEVLAISFQPSVTLWVYYDSTALQPDAFPRPSPRKSLEYRRYRQSAIVLPFSYREQAVAIRRFGVRPTSASLPERVIGIDFGDSVQLEAFIEFEDGSELDVSDRVVWVQDGDSQPYMSISSNGLVTESGGVVLSGRFQAEMMIEGELTRSEPSYVYASNSDNPAVLRAGVRDSWIVSDASQDDRALEIEAYVAQKDNQSSHVFVLNPSGTTWTPNGGDLVLLDNGLGADDLAGDGVYSARVTGQSGLSAGDNLKAIRAMLGPITFPPPPSPRKPLGTANSEPWPYFVINSSSSSPWPNPASPTQLQVESSRYQGARVVSMGFRGWKVANEYLLEVEAQPSALHPGAQVDVYANVPGIGYTAMTDEGGGIYSLKLSTVGAPSGLFVTHVIASIQSTGGTTYVSDFYPKIGLHSYPSWDLDEPADLSPSCGELEPSNW